MFPRLLGEAVAGAGYCVIDEPPRRVVVANGPFLLVPDGLGVVGGFRLMGRRAARGSSPLWH